LRYSESRKVVNQTPSSNGSYRDWMCG